jgi:HAD superfamily hydrolase (TIGR01484 family)
MTGRGTTPTRTSLILATDLDGTFAGGTAAERRALQRAIAAAPGSALVYVTGRTVAATRALMAEAALPHPDVLIADVGTTVVHGADFHPVAEIEAALDALWPGAAEIRQRLAEVEDIEEQDVRPPRRVSYWLRRGAMDEAIARMAERLEGLDVDLVGSAGVYLDVLPGDVNKGTTLRRVLRWLGRGAADVVVAGDTLNDLALFETGLAGVVVGNCEPALRERVRGREHLYFARGEGAAGILEGLHPRRRARRPRPARSSGSTTST